MSLISKVKSLFIKKTLTYHRALLWRDWVEFAQWFYREYGGGGEVDGRFISLSEDECIECGLTLVLVIEIKKLRGEAEASQA